MWKLAASGMIAAGLALSTVQAQPAASIEGTWDLTWTTRRGPERNGYMVITRSGNRLQAQIHGKGEVKAKGSLNGSAFSLKGSRMAVPYRIEGIWHGDRLEGSIKVLSVERRFTGVRRRR